VVLVLAAGCARDDGKADLPAVCKGDAAAYLDALASAPSDVRLGSTPISKCLAKDSTAGDVQLVGSLLIQAAQKLGDEKAALPLGYLVGAVRRGSDHSQGIYAEVVRRIEQEAGPFSRSRAFERGLRAGRTSG
jgi:hypothetical protein